METFAERLKIAIDKRAISQTEAARRIGISQQSINYIINNNLKNSKLAPKIAGALGINPEWLIYGKGKFEETKIYEIPIIHSLYMLNKFLKGAIDEKLVDCTIIDAYLGDQMFAYLIEPQKMVICYKDNGICTPCQYLTIRNSLVLITDEKQDFSFPIFEWRTRYVDF